VFDFVEDAAVGASIGEDGAWVGVAGEVTDEDVASDRLQRVLGIVGAMASRDDSGIEITEADVDGTTVTTITLPEEATEDMQVGGMPFAVGSLSIAISDGTLLFGTGDFVKDALTSDGSASLASSEGYTSAVGDSTPNLGLVYADIGGLMTTLDPLLSFVMDDWDDVSPWVAGLDRFVAVGTAEDSVISARLTLYVD
jgi:hypothetical protein